MEKQTPKLKRSIECKTRTVQPNRKMAEMQPKKGKENK